jgi:hypothetical protein
MDRFNRIVYFFRSQDVRTYRIKGRQQGVERGSRDEQAMEWARDDEPQIKGSGGRRNHPKRVLHAHEEQQRHPKQTRHPMEPRHVRHILRRPSQKRRSSLLLYLPIVRTVAVNVVAVSPGPVFKLARRGVKGDQRCAVHCG